MRSENTRESPIAVYQKTLSRHKQLIQTNKYAQELEKQYNKFRHKSQKEQVKTHQKATPHVWPINSLIFTEVLRVKLDTVLKSATPKASTRPSTRLKFTTSKFPNRKTFTSAFPSSYKQFSELEKKKSN